MSKAIVIDDNISSLQNVELPSHFNDINPHNFYLQIKSFQSANRANTARAKTRAEVTGSGKKPWSQKGRGTARSGSKKSPIWVGGGKAFGPTQRNYIQKVNKKQKKLAFNYALNDKATNEKLFVIENLDIPTGKTKDAKAFLEKMLNLTKTQNNDIILFVLDFDTVSEKTLLAFRNIPYVYTVPKTHLHTYLLTSWDSVVIQKSIFENLIKQED